MKNRKAMTLDEAEKLAKQTDYAFAAAETESNPINWGDAAAFFLEGVKWARENNLTNEERTQKSGV